MAQVQINSINADRVKEFLTDSGVTATVEDRAAEGMWVVADIPESQLKTLFNSYGDTYVPVVVREHVQHLQAYESADTATITNAQTVHVVKDLIRAVRHLNKRLIDG